MLDKNKHQELWFFKDNIHNGAGIYIMLSTISGTGATICIAAVAAQCNGQ
jgi:hypothetical protein